MAFTADSHWTIKLEGHLLEGTNNISPLGQDNFTYGDKDWSLFAGKVSFSF